MVCSGVTVGFVRWFPVAMLRLVSRLACFDSGMMAKIRLLLPTDLSSSRNV